MYILKEKEIENYEKLANIYGTPLYVYDADYIVNQYKSLSRLIKWPKLRIYYAMKANYNPAILKILLKEGAYLDTVSPGEIELAMSLGYQPSRLLHTANNLTDEEVEEVHSKKVLMNFDSLSRLEKYGKKYPGSKICLRFNPEVVAGEFTKIQTGGPLTKFGILMEDVPKVRELVHKYNLTVVGLHKHTGSGIQKAEQFLESMNNLLSIATQNNFPDLEFIDFGGGFKIPYKPDEHEYDYEDFGNKISDVFSDFCKRYGKDLELKFEPGKYIVAEGGVLLVRVNTLKDNQGRLIAGTDSGFPQLIRPMFYGAYHHIMNLSNQDGEEKVYDICGNICETGDCFATDRSILEIREGDVLALLNAGAYCYSMGGVYNLRPMPAELILYKSHSYLVRRRLTNNELANNIIKECDLKEI